MAKFIVRESGGEFYKIIVGDDMQSAAKKELGTQSAIAFHGYTIEPAPEAEVFESNDWLEDFNNPASRHHY